LARLLLLDSWLRTGAKTQVSLCNKRTATADSKGYKGPAVEKESEKVQVTFSAREVKHKLAYLLLIHFKAWSRNVCHLAQFSNADIYEYVVKHSHINVH
jgi:hypothetical protein